MKVTLLNFTPAPEKTVVLAAKLCYSDSNISQLEEKIKSASYEKFLGKILNMGHLSVLEHAGFTFGIEGISRATSHQLAKKFSDTAASLHNFYKEMIEAGIPAEDARYILPNAATTRIIVTMNARELLHFFGLRTCERAQWEIREMAKQMLSLVRKEAPFIFKKAGPGCVSTGKCTEGEMTCGRPDEIREEFKKL